MRYRFMVVALACGLSACTWLGSSNPPKVTIPPPVTGGPPGAALAWEKNNPNGAAWSQELRAQMAANLPSFEVAMTGSDYCPRYATLTADQKVEALSHMAVGIAFYESSYHPYQHFLEPGLGYDSIGLYQLSYEDGFAWCKMDKASKSLEDPLNNIRCAVPKMASLALKDKMISSSAAGDNRGLGKYWSVVRPGSTHYRKEIVNATRAYAACG